MSADTIIPNPTNPQSYNRYSYTRNNPLKFSDPSGHQEIACETTTCSGGGVSPTEENLYEDSRQQNASLKSWALVGWGLTSQGGISLAEIHNFIDGGQSTLVTRSLTNLDDVTFKPFGSSIKGVGRASNALSALSYLLIWGEWTGNIIDLEGEFESGTINNQQYDFLFSAANGQAVFNTTVNTIGLTSPLSGVAIGGSQALSNGCANIGWSCSDSGQAAGQVWAILTVGEVALSDGTVTTGPRMLIDELFGDS